MVCRWYMALRPDGISGAGDDAAFGAEVGIARAAIDAGACFLAEQALDRVADMTLALFDQRAIGQIVFLALGRQREQLLPALLQVEAAADACEQAFDLFVAE